MKREKKETCFLCWKGGHLEEHHIFNGSNRKKSTKYNYIIDVCQTCHRDIHADIDIRVHLKKVFQYKFEEQGTREEFRAIFGKSYL